MKIEYQVLADKIHLLIFDTQRDITSTFLRFQEHYESPQFRGKIFSLEEFKKWYIQNSPKGRKTGKFTYYTDWNGFNIPSYALKPFYQGKFDPLSEQEKKILEIFKNKSEPFYIIGIYRKTKKINLLLKHEVAHGLFYTNKNYRHEILEVLSKFNIEPIKEELRSKAGYNEQVLEDEVHSHGISSAKKLKTKIPRELTKQLQEIYKRYLNKVCKLRL